MEITELLDSSKIEIIAGIVIAILSFFFGIKKGKNSNKDKSKE